MTAAAADLFGGDSRQRTLAAVACSEEDGELLALGRVFEPVVVFISGPFARGGRLVFDSIPQWPFGVLAGSDVQVRAKGCSVDIVER